mgnify:CR=1 FL=1|jgi:hypothetical protein
MSLADIREGMATNLATISGIRVYEEVPDSPALPCAVIEIDRVNYNLASQRGLTEYTFTIHAIVVRTTERRAQRKLDLFIDDGARSIKTALESDSTLGGAAFDLRVSELQDIGPTTIGDITYMAAKFAVTVFAL